MISPTFTEVELSMDFDELTANDDPSRRQTIDEDDPLNLQMSEGNRPRSMPLLTPRPVRRRKRD